MIEGDKRLNIVFTGDSITHGPLHTKGYRSYTEHFRERLKKSLKTILLKSILGFLIQGCQELQLEI